MEKSENVEASKLKNQTELLLNLPHTLYQQTLHQQSHSPQVLTVKVWCIKII